MPDIRAPHSCQWQLSVALRSRLPGLASVAKVIESGTVKAAGARERPARAGGAGRVRALSGSAKPGRAPSKPLAQTTRRPECRSEKQESELNRAALAYRVV